MDREADSAAPHKGHPKMFPPIFDASKVDPIVKTIFGLAFANIRRVVFG